MSDPMRRPMPSPGGASPMGGTPGSPPGGGSGMQSAMRSSESPLNPTDMMFRQSQGRGVGPDTTIRQFLQSYGVDVDGPVSQLQKLAQNASPQGKMQGMAGGRPAPQRPGGPSPMGQSPMAQRPAGAGATPGRAAQPAPQDLSALLRR